VLAVKASLRIEGIGNVDNTGLTGSAGRYEVADPAFDPDKFFVYYFTRDCAGIRAAPCHSELPLPRRPHASWQETSDLSC
jgi:hypothetical protein